MSAMLFREFCALLPRAGAQIALASGAPLCHVPAGLVEFVPPKLSPRRDVDTPQFPRVLVVSAPGAVGKSTLARQLSHTATAPYWDLAQYGPVGQGTMGGAFLATFGFTGMASVQSALTSGQLAIVIDALDEARVKVNESAFEAFVRDIAATARTAPGVSFVVLGRNQIAETTWLILTDSAVDVGFYVIEPFDREEAVEYVDRRVTRLDQNAAQRVRTHAEPYRAARDLLLDGLEQAIAGSQPNAASSAEARDFVGYAPVLDAVSVLLAGETNLGQLRARLASEADGGVGSGQVDRPVALLRTVVNHILEREHGTKLVANIKPALQAVASQSGWANWNQLYTVEEQCERLVAHLLGTRYRPSTMLPVQVANQYEQQIASFLPEHPFLREGNSVFVSFLFARAVLRGTQTSAVEAYLSGKEYRPSRLFADFYFLETRQAEDSPISLPPQHVGLLYDALLAGESDRLAVRTTIEGAIEDDGAPTSPGTIVEGEFEIVDLTTLDAEEPRVSSRLFEMAVTQSDTLRFRRYLRDAIVVAPCVVELGSATDEFEIGPAVNIRAGTIRLSASKIIAGGRTKNRRLGEEHDDSVVLEADHLESSVIERPVAHVTLSVSWPGCDAFPWSAHATEPGVTFRHDPRLHDAYRRFRRILMTLRSHSKGSLARVKHKIDHARVLQGAVGEQLLRQLVGDGILVLRGNFYHLDPKRADTLTEMSWMELRRGRSSDRLQTYLRKFVDANTALFRS